MRHVRQKFLARDDDVEEAEQSESKRDKDDGTLVRSRQDRNNVVQVVGDRRFCNCQRRNALDREEG